MIKTKQKTYAIPTVCLYCGGDVELVDNSEIYGSSILLKDGLLDLSHLNFFGTSVIHVDTSCMVVVPGVLNQSCQAADKIYQGNQVAFSKLSQENSTCYGEIYQAKNISKGKIIDDSCEQQEEEPYEES